MSRRFIERRDSARPLSILPIPPDRPRRPPFGTLVVGAARYGPSFIAQVGFFYLALVVGDIIATGHTGGRLQLELGLAIAAVWIGVCRAPLNPYKSAFGTAAPSSA